MTSTDAQLARLLDEASVRDTVARFADAATRADHARFRETWASDARWVIGDGVDATGIEEIVAVHHRIRDEREFFVQIAVPGAIEIDGDHATTTSVCHEAARGPGPVYYRDYALSFDRLERAGERWVFVSRSFRYLWLDDSPFGGTGFPVPTEGPTAEGSGR